MYLLQGTTYSCAAVVRNKKLEIIPTKQGRRTMPSWVSFMEDGRNMVGEPAKAQAMDNPKNTGGAAGREGGQRDSSSFDRRRADLSLSVSSSPFSSLYSSSPPHPTPLPQCTARSA